MTSEDAGVFFKCGLAASVLVFIGLVRHDNPLVFAATMLLIISFGLAIYANNDYLE